MLFRYRIKIPAGFMFEIAVTSSLNQLDKYRVDPPPLFIFHITKNHNSQPHTYKFAIYWLIKYLWLYVIESWYVFCQMISMSFIKSVNLDLTWIKFLDPYVISNTKTYMIQDLLVMEIIIDCAKSTSYEININNERRDDITMPDDWEAIKIQHINFSQFCCCWNN